MTVSESRPVVATFPGNLPPVLQAAYWMVLTALTFGAMSTIIRIVSDDVHPFEAGFFRSLFGLIWIAPMLARHGRPALRGGRRLGYMMRSGFSVFGLIGSFYGVVHMTIADAISLSFTAPLFVTMGAALILHERVRLRRWTATLVGFAGVMVIIQPGPQLFDNPTAFIVLTAAAASAGSMLTVRSLAASEHPNAIVAGMAIYLTPLSLIPALFVWTWPSWGTLGWMVLLGLFGTLGQLTVTRALAAAEASVVMPFDYLRLPVGALVAFLIFGEAPTLRTFVGAGIVACSTIYIARREAALARQGKG